MFNRKKIEWMAEEIRKLKDEIEYLNVMIDALTYAHLAEPSNRSYVMLNGNIRYVPCFFHEEKRVYADTRECGEISFKELARYVIDKEPIAREVTSTKYFEHPDNCQSKTEETDDELDNN